jgi:hypothetical protein
MKNILLLITLMVAAGCGQNQNPLVRTENPVDLTDSEVAEEISAMDAKTSREAVRMAALLTVGESVKGFKMMHKRYPATLNELVEKGMLHSLPDLPADSDYVYDAGSGEVTLTGGTLLGSKKETSAAK